MVSWALDAVERQKPVRRPVVRREPAKVKPLAPSWEPLTNAELARAELAELDQALNKGA
jgi:hypothetical protein